MDIKKSVEDVVERLKSDDKLREQFKKEPAKTVESLLGVELPDDVKEKVVAGVKGKISLDKVSGVTDKIKGLF